MIPLTFSSLNLSRMQLPGFFVLFFPLQVSETHHLRCAWNTDCQKIQTTSVDNLKRDGLLWTLHGIAPFSDKSPLEMLKHQ